MDNSVSLDTPTWLTQSWSNGSRRRTGWPKVGACSSWLKLPVLCIARAIDCDVVVRLIIFSMPRIIECDVRARGAVILGEVSGFVFSDFGVEARVNAFSDEV